MKKDDAYHSTLSVHCQWEESTEECSTYEQSHYYRALHRTDQFNSQHKRIYHVNELIAIQQQVWQCLWHFAFWII